MRDWYLMSQSTTPNALGGYESDVFDDYKTDVFQEILATNLATTVTVYNSDLSESNTVRCVIQNNTADTQLNALNRVGFFEIGTVKAGNYVYYDNIYWLAVGYPGNNGVYEKVVLNICQYELRWQNDNGDIISRWCNAVTASKYNMGESSGSTIVLKENDITLTLPEDDEVLNLTGRRVFVDPKDDNPTEVYRVTRNDDILFLYGEHGGVISFIVDQDRYNPDTDNQELKICDYRAVDSTNTDGLHKNNKNNKNHNRQKHYVKAVFSGGRVLRCPTHHSWVVTFENEHGEPVKGYEFKWNVISDFELEQTIDGNTITLFSADESLVGQSFKLQVLRARDDKVIGEIQIDVVGLL